MPEIITISAQCQSASVTRRVFKSAKRNSHSGGSIAAAVISPRGGIRVWRLSNLQDSARLQKEGGILGYNSRTLT